MQYHHMALVDHHKVPKFGLDMQSSSPNTHQSTALPASQPSWQIRRACPGLNARLSTLCMRLTPKLAWVLQGCRQPMSAPAARTAPCPPCLSGRPSLSIPLTLSVDESTLGQDRTPSWPEPRIALTVSADVARCYYRYYILQLDGSDWHPYRGIISSGDPHLPGPRLAMHILATCAR